MSIDVYQTCLCGSGKKIKFCCCKDITNDLGKVIEKLDSEQRVAALDQVNKVIQRHGNRAALLAIKAIAELQLGNEEGAATTVATFLKEFPDNCVALALTAAVKSGEEDPRAGIEPLQRALEKTSDVIPEAVYESIGAVAEALLVTGHVLAARAHYLLQSGLSGDQDQDVTEVLARLAQSPQLSLLMKQTPQLDECPDDSPLKADFDAALDLAGKGMWLAAAERFEQLAAKHADEPSPQRNLGVLYCCLARTEEAVAAFHRYAAADGDLNLDDQVEAEALAQLLEPIPDHDKVPVQLLKHEVSDVEKLLERFENDRRLDRMPIDTSRLAGDDSPPPKAAFFLLDRPMPETGIVTQREEIPNVLGDLLVYGRETDREARLEAAFAETEDFDKKVKALAEVTGDLVAESHEREKIGETLAAEAALSWNWRMPQGVPVDQREEFLVEQRREVIFEKWPHTKTGALDGKTPSEVREDPSYRVKLLANLWLLELTGDMQLWKIDFDELRSELDLPCPETIDPTEIDVLTIPLTRLSRIAVDKLDDTKLATVFQRAFSQQANNATRNSGGELLRRESTQDKIKRSLIYGVLMKTAQDTRTALDYAHKAQQAARDENQSPAQWLLAELPIRLRRGEAGDFRRVLREIESNHLNEPGISQAVTRLLVNYGILTKADIEAAMRQQAMSGATLGKMKQAQAAALSGAAGGLGGAATGMAAPVPPAGAPAAGSPAPAAGGAPAQGGVWIPGATPQPAQPDPSGEKKPKIWTPGMD